MDWIEETYGIPCDSPEILFELRVCFPCHFWYHGPEKISVRALPVPLSVQPRERRRTIKIFRILFQTESFSWITAQKFVPILFCLLCKQYKKIMIYLRCEDIFVDGLRQCVDGRANSMNPITNIRYHQWCSKHNKKTVYHPLNMVSDQKLQSFDHHYQGT
jgi:hypothetical protein